MAMERDAAYSTLEAALARIAPEVSLDEVDRDADLLEELELDSMDLLALVTELHQRTGVQIPEADYGELSTVESTVRYLMSRS